MIRIALVGDIGSGKTYIASLFGYPVFNADSVVAEIYKKNKKCFNSIKKKLPNFFSSFPLKKKELIKCILANKTNLKKISKIIHPLVRKQMKIFIHKNNKKKFVILDIPLFLENRLNKKNDVIIYVQSSKTRINKRLKKRVNYNRKLIVKFKKVQWPLKKKKSKSDLIIKNKFKHKEALKSVNSILKDII
tara:strand:+ start:2063 stop:2632 length:570 start_codon:yes stop_codon:yes gene_type:complete